MDRSITTFGSILAFITQVWTINSLHSFTQVWTNSGTISSFFHSLSTAALATGIYVLKGARSFVHAVDFTPSVKWKKRSTIPASPPACFWRLAAPYVPATGQMSDRPSVRSCALISSRPLHHNDLHMHKTEIKKTLFFFLSESCFRLFFSRRRVKWKALWEKKMKKEESNDKTKINKKIFKRMQ